MGNPFAHIELHTSDLADARAFYAKLFDWTLESAPGDYTMISAGEGIGGGMMQDPKPGAPSAWLAYVTVDDVAAHTAHARDLGARVAVELTEVPGMGTFSVIIDPTGAPIGLWQPLTPVAGS